jgi:hypothetical protein
MVAIDTDANGDRRLTRDEFVPIWTELRDRVIGYLEGLGMSIDPFGHKDFWVVDHDLNIAMVQVEISNLALLHPPVIYGLRDLLVDYPHFAITVAVIGPHGADGARWPRMGISLYKGQIIDGLKRAYLPGELREVRYAGSIPD